MVVFFSYFLQSSSLFFDIKIFASITVVNIILSYNSMPLRMGRNSSQTQACMKNVFV